MKNALMTIAVILTMFGCRSRGSNAESSIQSSYTVRGDIPQISEDKLGRGGGGYPEISMEIIFSEEFRKIDQFVIAQKNNWAKVCNDDISVGFPVGSAKVAFYVSPGQGTDKIFAQLQRSGPRTGQVLVSVPSDISEDNFTTEYTKLLRAMMSDLCNKIKNGQIPLRL